MSAKKRKYSCSSCKCCFNNKNHLKDHILVSKDCQQSYFVCDCCNDYVGDKKQGLLQHFNSPKGISRGCEDHYNMKHNPDVAILPTSICHSSYNQNNKETLRINEDVDLNFNLADPPQMDSISHVFQPGNNSNQIQFVQFKSNVHNNNGFINVQNTGGIASPNNNYLTKQTASNAKNISTNGKFGNVTSTLPGVVNDRFIVHKPEYKKYHTRDDCISLSSTDSDDCDTENCENFAEFVCEETDIVQDEQNLSLEEFSSAPKSGGTIRVIRLPNEISEMTHDVPSNGASSSVGNNVLHDEASLNISQTLVPDKNLKCRFPMKNVNIDNVEVSSEDATKSIDDLNKHFNDITFSDEDECLLDLYQILQQANAPRNLFDKIIDWSNSHKDIIGYGRLRKRDRMMNHWHTQVGADRFRFKPIVSSVELSSGRRTNLTTFSLRTHIMTMLTNKQLFKPENILLNPDDPTSIPDDNSDYGEPNTGSWMKEAYEKKCFSNKHVLMPFGCFVDELKIDKFGKIGSEAVIICCQWFNRSIRKTEAPWYLLGFLENQNFMKSPNPNYSKQDKMQDYHDMIAHIFREFRSIEKNGGINVDLDFGNGNLHKNIVLLPVIQYIIGDCKGNDVHCGRKGTHSLNTPLLCRDCDIPSIQADNVDYICKFTKQSDIFGKNTQELDSMSRYNIRNAFHDLPFGGCEFNIHGNSPPEILHNYQLGKCNDLGRELSFSDKANECISEMFKRLYPFAKCQSERNLPNLRPFRNGLSSVKSLKATERFDRIFAMYLSLMNPFLIRTLRKFKRMGTDNACDHNAQSKNTTQSIKQFVSVLEDTLILHEWLKLESIPRDDVNQINNSRAFIRIREYSRLYRDTVVLDKYEHKTTKFHQLMHVVWYITRHGVFDNVNGSMGEKMGKIYVKDMAKTTNKDRDTLNTDIAIRIAEKFTIDKLISIRDMSKKVSLSEKVNKFMIRKNTNGTTNKRFTLSIKITDHDNHTPNNVQAIRLTTNWINCVPPKKDFPEVILLAVANRLFNWKAELGGKLTPDSVVKGFTEYRPVADNDNLLFRANPYFRNQGSWYDWAYFKWGEDSETAEKVPGRIVMFVDLSDCTIINEPQTLVHQPNNLEQDEYLENDIPPIHKLTTEKYAVIQSAKSNKITHTDEETILTDEHFDSKISHWIELEQKYRIVPLSTLDGPVFVLDTIPFDDGDYKDNTALVVKSQQTWGEEWLKY